jgi:hypothetical protein
MRDSARSLPRLLVLAPAVAALAALAVTTSCRSTASVATLSSAESAAIADSIRAVVTRAYDLSTGDVPARMLSVYPNEGRVVSATAGRVTATRDLVGSAVSSFWEGVGQYMVRPTWKWDAIQVDVLSRDAAVMTAQYTVPHWTSDGNPHVIGGVWSAVWQRRDGRWLVTHEHLSDMPRAAAEALEATMPSIAPAPAVDSLTTPLR